MEKKKYIYPEIEVVQLDNEISLVLNSNPPAGPDELVLNNVQSPFENEAGLI
jgi:hypothetical protein